MNAYKVYEKAKTYLNDVLTNRNEPIYVIKQCEQVKDLFDGTNSKYEIKVSKLKQLNNILKLLIMPTGSKTGESVLESLAGFQCLILVVVWCSYVKDSDKRRFENVLIELPRKTGKTMIIALLFIIALLTEPKFSRLFSCAPDGSLSREVYTLIQQFIQMSPYLQEYNGKSLFKITRDKLTCNATKSEYVPLNYSTSRMDGRMPSIWLCDETSALPSSYPISALRLGSLPVKNKLGIMISTKYTSTVTPFEDEIVYFKSVLDNNVSDDTAFCMLFEPDEKYKANWETSDEIIDHVNPLAKSDNGTHNEIEKLRTRAVEIPSQRSQFLCKMLNIISSDVDADSYVDVNAVKACEIDTPINWKGKDVYVGLDLSQTTDNTCVSIVGRDELGYMICQPMCFIPSGRIDHKTRTEKCDYDKYIKNKNCIACGDDVIDYSVVEDYILNIEKQYGCNVIAVGYDRYNAMSTVNKLTNGGLDCIEVKQHSSVLSAPTKYLLEEILNDNFKFERNELFVLNFENAKCTYDTNLNRYITKKKSNGKIDMVVATLDAVALLQQNELLSTDWVCQ